MGCIVLCTAHYLYTPYSVGGEAAEAYDLVVGKVDDALGIGCVGDTGAG